MTQIKMLEKYEHIVKEHKHIVESLKLSAEKLKQKRSVRIQYNGFHGRNFFSLRAHVEPVCGDSGDPNYIVGYDIDLSPAQVRKINKVVGCKTHTTVFGADYKIPGACGCGEGVKDWYGRENDVTIRVNDNYIYRGRYPQN